MVTPHVKERRARSRTLGHDRGVTEILTISDPTAALGQALLEGEADGAVVGVAATHLVTGRHIGHREGEIFGLASVIKVPVLVTLYEEVLAGRADLRERVTYRASAKVPGSGVLQDLDDGLTLTLRDLAVLMIIVSDNTAAEMLTVRLTKARVEAAMARYGLASIKMPLGVRALLYELVDLDHSRPGQYDEAKALLRQSAGSGGRAVIPDQTDRGSPHDLCRLMESIGRHEILDEPSCEDILDILRRNKSDSRIPALLPKGTVVAHKTGTIRGVRNDVGIVHAPSGPYAVAILSRGLPSDIRGDVRIAEISLKVFEAFA
jgi:beta-lactamase class A